MFGPLSQHEYHLRYLLHNNMQRQILSMSGSYIPSLMSKVIRNNKACVLKRRIAYTFGFKGPSASIDTACSASLVSTHMAVQAIHEQQADAAVSAGVLLCIVPQSTLMCHRAGMLSPDGRCKVGEAALYSKFCGSCTALFQKQSSSGVCTFLCVLIRPSNIHAEIIKCAALKL